jgi:hypothetical protein
MKPPEPKPGRTLDVITKTLFSAAIVLGALAGAAPAAADATPCSAPLNPYGGLTARPHEPAPPGASQSD